MSYWIFKTDSNSSHFTLAKTDRDYEYELTDYEGEDLINSTLSAGDNVFVYRDDPASKINFLLEFISPTSFRKTHELEGINRDAIIGLIPDLIPFLDPSNDELLFNLNEEQYNLLLESFLQSGNIQTQPTPTTRNNVTDDIPLSHNRIIFGAPGTGKSYLLEEQREEYFGDHYERVTFYPNYTYGQFFGTYKPIKEIDEPISYEFVPGPFFRLLIQAYNNRSENYLLIIEEINRANAAAVFGDVFQLLDRDDDGISEYSVQLSEDAIRYLERRHPHLVDEMRELTLPENFYIWTTMNSADQGVQPLDSAFKRRFDFEYIGINANQSEIENIPVTIPGIQDPIDWNHFRRTLNSFLMNEFPHVKEDKLIGPFFIKESILRDEEKFEKAFKNKLLMYLSEDILKTANKEKLFNARTYSNIIEIYEEENNVDRRVFSTAFYLELTRRAENDRGSQTERTTENPNPNDTPIGE